MTSAPVAMEMRGGVAWLTLARPETRNAISPELARSLLQRADSCAADPAIRCVVLAAEGRFFSVGGDIGLFAEAGDNAERKIFALAEEFNAGVHRLATMAKPLVTVVNGPAAGAGFSLAMLGDIVLAAASAHFTVAYTAIGLTPDGGASWWLPRLVGLRRAQEMVLTNRRVDSEEAVRIGLVTRQIPDAELADAADQTARALAAGATHALGQCRRLLLASATASLADQLSEEAAAIAAASVSPEGREGITAFIARRSPDFPGA